MLIGDPPKGEIYLEIQVSAVCCRNGVLDYFFMALGGTVRVWTYDISRSEVRSVVGPVDISHLLRCYVAEHRETIATCTDQYKVLDEL